MLGRAGAPFCSRANQPAGALAPRGSSIRAIATGNQENVRYEWCTFAPNCAPLLLLLCPTTYDVLGTRLNKRTITLSMSELGIR